jgi:hypothetical protein
MRTNEIRSDEDLLLEAIDAHCGAENFLETIQNFVDNHGEVDAEFPDADYVDDFVRIVEMLESVAEQIIDMKRRRTKAAIAAQHEYKRLAAQFAE